MLDSNDVFFAQNCADNLPGCRQKLIMDHQEMVRRTVAAVLNRYSDQIDFHWAVDDLTQEIFTSLFENNAAKLRTFQGQNGCSLETWLRVVAIRRTLNFFRCPHLRNQSISAKSELPFPDQRPGTDEVLLYKEAATFVREAVGRLSATNRLIFKMIFEDEFNYDEAARACRMSKSTLYCRVSRIKDQLRRMLIAEGFLFE